MKPVVIGLGNDLLGDDGVGLLAARRLAEVVGDDADIIECRCAGLSLLDPLAGRSRAIIVDAICTGNQPAGTIYRANPGDLRDIPNLSPHYAGLPEVIRMAGHLRMPFPSEIEIVAIEAEDVGTIGAGLTQSVAEALPKVIEVVLGILAAWKRDPGQPVAREAGVPVPKKISA